MPVKRDRQLQILESRFEISAASLKQLPQPPRTEVAFVGRSNVGKSSLINLLLGRKALAKISARPGKTRLLNYFLVNGEIHFVDLPGYGYAKTPEEMRQDWAKLIEGYLVAPRRKLILQLVDARHGMTRLDRESLLWLLHHMLPVVVVLTKADKLSAADLREQQQRIRRSLKDLSVLQVVSTSTRSRNGRDELLEYLGHWLSRNSRKRGKGE